MKPTNKTDKKRNLWGYVNTTGRQSNIITENGDSVVETIHPYAFKETLKSNQDIPFRLNHQKILGYHRQNLKLKEDNVGLYAEGFVQDEETIDKLDRGEIAGWSLQFYDVPGETNSWRDQQGILHRDIYKLDLCEVSLLDIDNVPAYTATSIHSRANDGGRRTIYNFISDYEPMHSRALPNIGVVPQYAGVVPQYIGAAPQYAGVVPQYIGAAPQYASVPQYIGAAPQYASVPQYIGAAPQYASVPYFMVSMPSVAPQVEARKPVMSGASLEVKTPDKGDTEKETKPKAEPKAEAKEAKPKAEPEVEAKEAKPKAEPEVEAKEEDNKNIDLSEIMKELSSDADTIKKYYKNEV